MHYGATALWLDEYFVSLPPVRCSRIRQNAGAGSPRSWRTRLRASGNELTKRWAHDNHPVKGILAGGAVDSLPRRRGLPALPEAFHDLAIAEIVRTQL